jgi:restriction system protein
MPVPSYQELMLPVLTVLAEQGAMKTADCADQVASRLGLSDEEKTEMLPSGGQRLVVNRAGWAAWYMMQAGLVGRPKRGIIEATEEGRKLLATKPALINNSLLQTFPQFVERMKRQDAGNEGKESTVPSAGTKEETATPEERILGAFSQLNDSLASELQDQMAKMDPFRFEQLVVDLLFAMGYGGSREEAAKVTKKSGDEGIDGVINEDRLGLDVIYIQAKRWQASMGRREIQSFVGALAGQQANKGVFITTSDFGQNAIDYARSVPQKVILIDGERLAELMIEHNIGVTTTRTISLKRIDSDYFEES